MCLYPQKTDVLGLQLLAKNLRLFYAEKRPAKRLQRFNGPNINGYSGARQCI